MTRYSRIIRLFLVLGTLALASASPAWCDTSMVLFSSAGGVCDYMLAPSGTVFFDKGSQITLSGMDGVTGGASLYNAFALHSFTPTTVVLEQDAFSFIGFSGGPFLIAEVDSTVLTLGTIDWSLQTSNGTLTGTVQGPVAPVPEPSSLLLLGTGLIGLGASLRRRTRRTVHA